MIVLGAEAGRFFVEKSRVTAFRAAEPPGVRKEFEYSFWFPSKPDAEEARTYLIGRMRTYRLPTRGVTLDADGVEFVLRNRTAEAQAHGFF